MSTGTGDALILLTRIRAAAQNAVAVERDRRIVLAASVGVVQRIVQIAATLVTMPLVLAALGPGRFGIWGAVTSLAWLIAIVDLGVGSALVTMVARAIALGQGGEVRSYIASALAIGGTVAVLLLAAGSTVILMAAPRAETGPYLVAIAGLALNVPLSISGALWLALQKGHIASFWELAMTVLMTGGLVAAAAFSRDTGIYVAVVYGALVLANLGSLVQLFLRHPHLRPSVCGLRPAAMRRLAGSGSRYFLLTLSSGLSFLLDNVLTLALLGPEASARMTVALRLCISASGILFVISQPLWPAFAEASARADRRWIGNRLLSASVLMVTAAVAGSAVLVAMGPRLFRWWLHTDLAIGSGLLWAMAAWLVVYALNRVPGLLLNALAITTFQVVLYSVATAVAIALKVVLAPRFDTAGILLATAITGTLIVAPALFWRVHSRA